MSLPGEAVLTVDCDKTDSMILRVTDIDVAFLVHTCAMRAFERCSRGRTAVSGAPGLPRSSHRRDQPASSIDATDAVVFGIDEDDVVVAIDGDLLRAIEGGLQRRPMIASVAPFTRTGNGADE